MQNEDESDSEFAERIYQQFLSEVRVEDYKDPGFELPLADYPDICSNGASFVELQNL